MPVSLGGEPTVLLPAGDLRRALASTERLCLVLGDEGAFELRDVAALYLHAEDLPAAMTHLHAYAVSRAAKGSISSLSIHTLPKLRSSKKPMWIVV